ncbi:MAG: hypothetical protein EOO55_02700 [Hymenobacter sp.]|nr:MAG: hypothetical protein EOO55_02700 [Hymenobacter sp.]
MRQRNLTGGPPQGPGGGPKSPAPVNKSSPAYPSLQALQMGAFVRTIASGERYLDALRVKDVASRAAHLSYVTREARPDATRRGRPDAQSFANQQRYAALLAAKPRYSIRPGLTPAERLWINTVATMPYELALMVRYDPVVRSVGGAVVVVGAVEAAPALYIAGEDALVEGLEATAGYLEAEGTALYNNFGAVTIRSFILKASINSAGQGLGNYLVTHDARQAAQSVNLLSAAASGLNVPLGYNSLFSAGFGYSREKGFKSVVTGDISSYEFGRDAAFNYGFGKVAAGFKFTGSAGCSWMGLDKLYQTQPLNYSVGFATYQAMLRTGPRIGYGLGLGLGVGLEHGNKIVVGATKKYLGTKLKTSLPDPAKAHGH